MGQPKHLLELDGKTFLQHCLDALTPVVDEIVVSIGPTQPKPRSLPSNAKIAIDASPFEGPLSGIAAGLAVISTESAMIVSCDAPLLMSRLLELLFESLEERDLALANTNGPQFFPGVYRKCVGETAAVMMARGERRVGALAEVHSVNWVALDEILRIDPGLESFRDVDTAGDFASIRRIDDESRCREPSGTQGPARLAGPTQADS
jgi:molybdopterin-guanine dinucleotide biosynthesis protein A